jgi:rhamnulose-1-phosphate aldolase
MAHSSRSVGHAVDLIEYAETAARYETLNLASGEPSSGLSNTQIQAICQSLGLQQTIF